MGKKFDICLMNPPYGDSTAKNKQLHHTFVTACNSISNQNVVVMPFRMITAKHNKFDKYKEEYNNILLSIEEYDAASDFGIAMGSVGVYTFDNKNGNNNKIHIAYKTGESKQLKSLFDITSITKTDKEIFSILDNNNKYNYYIFSPRGKDKTINLDTFAKRWLSKHKSNTYLTTNIAAGSSRPGTYYTSKTGDICDSNDFINTMLEYKGKAIVVMLFESIQAAENCKIALNHPLLRMCLHKFQDDQNIKQSHYKYIPDIDWLDDRARTDEGLLEVCGCPKDKIKEYAQYAKDYIKKIDDEYDNRKHNMGKKFDICLMNPPYGSNELGNKDLHYMFVTACNNISNNNVVVMPFRMIEAKNNKFDKYKTEYDNILLSIEEYDANAEFDIAMGSVGVYTFDNKNGNNNEIHISYKNGTKENVKSLMDANNNISEYEKNILKYLDNKGNISYIVVGSAGKNGRDINIIKNQYIKRFNPNDVLLLTNFSNGSGRPYVFMSPNTGQIFKAKDAQKCEYAMKGYRSVITVFKEVIAAKNCKVAMKNPLLRFGLSKLQDCQDLSKRMRQYIPDIDWSDDRVRTDEGLLEVCGCPKDKIKEYAQYAKDYIKKIDDEYDNRKHNMGKKFDICLMNPPFDGTLHLKFVGKCLNICKNIICVEPIDKFMSPKLVYAPYTIQEYKKLEPILKHCHSIEQIDTKQFGIAIQAECGITVWSDKEEKDWTPDKYLTSVYNDDERAVIKKVMSKIKEDGDKNNLFYFVHHRDESLGDIVQWVPSIHGHVKSDGGKQNDFYEIYSKDYKKAIAVKEPKNRAEASELRFKNEDEQKNFIESTFLQSHKIIMSFWKTDTKIRLKFIPFLHDYSKSITDETIMNFFNLTNEEKKIFINIQLRY